MRCVLEEALRFLRAHAGTSTTVIVRNCHAGSGGANVAERANEETQHQSMMRMNQIIARVAQQLCVPVLDVHALDEAAGFYFQEGVRADIHVPPIGALQAAFAALLAIQQWGPLFVSLCGGLFCSLYVLWVPSQQVRSRKSPMHGAAAFGSGAPRRARGARRRSSPARAFSAARTAPLRPPPAPPAVEESAVSLRTCCCVGRAPTCCCVGRNALTSGISSASTSKDRLACLCAMARTKCECRDNGPRQRVERRAFDTFQATGAASSASARMHHG